MKGISLIVALAALAGSAAAGTMTTICSSPSGYVRMTLSVPYPQTPPPGPVPEPANPAVWTIHGAEYPEALPTSSAGVVLVRSQVIGLGAAVAARGYFAKDVALKLASNLSFPNGASEIEDVLICRYWTR